jgi:hypothetical protein
MSNQPKALRLAKEIHMEFGCRAVDAAAELRRLHQVELQRDELLEALWSCITVIERTQHCTEADRLTAATNARATINKVKGQS